MAARGLQIDRNTFCCSICLDFLKEPVTIPCGHSYCMSCVNTHWDGEVGKQSYSCPQCRQNFTQRPVLVKNTMLAVLMEGLKKSGPPAAPVAPSSAAQGDVFCDLCSGRKVKAVKSCLQCLVSYCKEHLQPHYDVAALKKHKLVEPTENLQENICSRHDEVMKMFCRTDQQCICYLCSVDQHKGHHTVTAAAERTEKQRELQAFQQDLLHRIELKEKDVASLQHQLKNSSRSAYTAVELSDRSLKELLHLLEKRMSEVKQQVRSQQEAEEHRVRDLQNNVQQEITELRKKLTELDTLSHNEDHVHFLHKFSSLSKFSDTSDSINSSQTPPPFQDMVTAAVSKLRSTLQETSLFDPPVAVHKAKMSHPKKDAFPAGAQGTAPSQQTSQREGCTVTLPLQSLQLLPIQGDVPSPPVQILKETSLLVPPITGYKPKAKTSTTDALPAGARATVPSQQTFHEEWPALPCRNMKMNTTVSISQSLPPDSTISSQPPIMVHFKSTRELRDYVRDLTMDPQSLNDNLILTDENLLVQNVGYYQDYSRNSARFTHFPQVVSKQSLTGRCSWMVEGSQDTTDVTVAVAYKSIRRDGSSNECYFGKNVKSWALKCNSYKCEFWHNGSCLTIPKGPGKIVVFLDFNAGILSFFYRMDVELHHIHTVRTTFTKPLVAGLRLEPYSYAKLCGPEFY